MNRLPMPLAYACARFANGCLLQLTSTVDRVSSRPVEQRRRPARRLPASTHITVRSADVQPAVKCLLTHERPPSYKAAIASHPIDVDWEQ